MLSNPKVRSFAENFYFAVEWRIIATTITFIAAFIVSGSFTVSLSIASVEVLIKIIVQIFWLKYRVRKR